MYHAIVPKFQYLLYSGNRCIEQKGRMHTNANTKGTNAWISCVSPTLIPAEKNYSGMEKGALVVVTGIINFHFLKRFFGKAPDEYPGKSKLSFKRNISSNISHIST